jgi:hypothetical protein
MASELVPIEKIAADLQSAADKYGPSALSTVAAAAKCFQLAEGVRLTRELVKQSLPYVKHLQGSRLGYLTDRDPGKTDKPPYPDTVIAECLTEALLKGARWTDNEINILFGSVHYTLAYWRRIVGELPDVSDLDISTGVPKLFDGGATVDIAAKFKISDKPVEMRRVFTVRLTSGMGADGAIGKATRRMLAAIHHRVTGSQQSADAAVGADEGQDATPASKTAALEQRLNGPAPQEPRQVQTEATTAKPVSTTTDPEEIANDIVKFSRLLTDKGLSRPAAITWLNREFEAHYPANTKLDQLEPLHGRDLVKHLLTLPNV